MDLSHIYFLSEVGGKTNQEDFIWPHPGTATLYDKVFIVCDGVGGSDNGEIASRIISESVGESILASEKREISGLMVDTILEKARQLLVKYAYQHGLNTDMATTLTLLVLSDKKVFISWCGDSRIYHIRKGVIQYKTSDHSLVNSLVKSGEITEEEAQNHPRKNVILRAIKADESPLNAEHHLFEDVRDGDYFLLCTDGILENITDKDLTFLITQHDKGNIDIIKAFQQFCHGKTRDNYSMYLLKVSISQKSAGYKKKITVLVSFLVLLILTSAIILRSYYTKKQHIDKETVLVLPEEPQKQNSPDTINNSTSHIQLNADTIIQKNKNTMLVQPVKKDSVKTINPIIKRKTKDPVFIIIDNSGDTILEKQEKKIKEPVSNLVPDSSAKE